MNPRTAFLIQFAQAIGVLARAIYEDRPSDFISACFTIRKIADTAIQQLSFRVIEPVGDDDDEDV